MTTGTVKCIVQARGFGFIVTDASDDDVFFHADDLLDGLDFDATLQERRVRFDLGGDNRGARARRVRPAD